MIASTHYQSSELKNFLFMVPATATEVSQELALTLARRLTGEGYVYLASASQLSMEDRDDIRFMPLHPNPDSLPAFGLLTAVFVVEDEMLAAVVREEYPGSEVFVLRMPVNVKAVKSKRSKSTARSTASMLAAA